MTKIIIPILCIATLTFTSCKKKDKDNPHYTCSSCVTQAEALAANDGSSKGVYKGILIGSSGTIKFSIQNGTNDITATMVVDGVSAILTSTVSWVSGQPYIAPFTGTLNGQAVSITFSVQNNGSTPQIISSNIPGHPNAVFTIIKETSNALVEGFEGTYSTTEPETGTFNILLSRPLGQWGGISRENGQTATNDVSGTITSSGDLFNDNNIKVATLSGDDIDGTFTDNSGNTVTVAGKRTL
ncbi:MAG: hypothetical protein KIS71_10515 [Bacteroidetes bacterium]|nr:hypothetical protein [Bacteroidota bacterium]